MSPDDLWDALKRQCCATKPDSEHWDDVSTVVMVRRADIDAITQDLATKKARPTDDLIEQFNVVINRPVLGVVGDDCPVCHSRLDEVPGIGPACLEPLCAVGDGAALYARRQTPALHRAGCKGLGLSKAFGGQCNCDFPLDTNVGDVSSRADTKAGSGIASNTDDGAA